TKINAESEPMEETEKAENGKAEKPEAVERTSTLRPLFTDPWDRWAAGDFPWRPMRIGRLWPDRLLGEFSGLFDHLKIEEYIDEGFLVVRAEIPGVDPESDIDISVEDQRLVIHAERTSRTEDDTDGYRSEFHYGSFSRVIGLPEGANVDDVQADYADGILEVRIPIAEEEARPAKKVPIGRR
ncbi:MAG: Hsp20/alpha crystallin family protein, partial [Acidimicrobiia bacterium]|nr:Hsp20/alpha crystallin family protein [Acidimicrobiia bacterium]